MADAKFLSAGIGGGSLTPTVDTFSLSARVPEGGISAGLRAIVSEAKRVREFGFNASELDRAKRSMAAFYERAYNERDKTESGSFAQEYISYFLNGEPSPGIEYEYRLVQQVLPAITLEEVTALARARMADESSGDSGDRPREGRCTEAVGRRAAHRPARGRRRNGHRLGRRKRRARAHGQEARARQGRVTPRAR